jgi:Flp pilus assembly protein CpaB
MKPHHAFTIFLAGLAFLAGYAASFKPIPPVKSAASAKESPQQVEVWVAREALPLGTRLDPPEKYLKRASFRSGEEPKDAIVVGTIALEGRKVVRPLQQDELLQKTFLLDDKLTVQENMMLYAFSYEPYGRRGYVRPGMRVDVIVQALEGNRPTVKVLMEDIAVAHHRYWEAPQDQYSRMQEFTLVVTPDQAKLLQETRSKGGSLHVSIRSGLTSKTIVGQTFDPKTERLFSPPKKEEKSSPMEPVEHLGFFSRLSRLPTKEK